MTSFANELGCVCCSNTIGYKTILFQGGIIAKFSAGDEAKIQDGEDFVEEIFSDWLIIEEPLTIWSSEKFYEGPKRLNRFASGLVVNAILEEDEIPLEAEEKPLHLETHNDSEQCEKCG